MDTIVAAPDRQVILIGGKGGVGKTTCSAAIAARFAALGMRTLLITSDLTPSLSDVLEETVGDTIRTVSPNLDAYEISQEAISGRWKSKFGPDFYDVLSHLIDVEALNAESRHELLDYIGSAPSLREETMLDIIRELALGSGYQRVVWDTAPAGETLNLLSMPQNIRRHLRAGAKVYEGLDRIGKRIAGKRSIAGIMDEWAAASEEISAFLQHRSVFTIVANPESLVVCQTRRLLASLRGHGVALGGMIINRIAPAGASALSAQADRVHAGYVQELRQLAGSLPVALVPLSYPEITGLQKLQLVGEKLVSDLGLGSGLARH